MLVKELRQGLKSRAFVYSFMALHVLMAWDMLLYVVQTETSRDRDFPNFLFWFVIGAALLVIFPLRASGP